MTARKILVYFEGDRKLKHGFRTFLRKIGGDGLDARPCGSRDEALRSFVRALTDHPDAFNILLVDSEGPVITVLGKPWDHLQSLASGRLMKPDGANDDHAHLMVQMMESWFLADKDTLAHYYGQGFLVSRLPSHGDVEAVPKDGILNGLKGAAAGSKKKLYHKGVHAPEILARIDPAKVRAASPWCERLFATIERQIEGA